MVRNLPKTTEHEISSVKRVHKVGDYTQNMKCIGMNSNVGIFLCTWENNVL